VGLVSGRKPVPPTPYYYKLRAEWFRKEADKYLSNNQLEKYYEFFNRYLEYEQLGELLPLYDNRTTDERVSNEQG
jgi:hypothetical protein